MFQILQDRGMKDRRRVLEQVQTEVKRRLTQDEASTGLIESVKQNYTRICPGIFSYTVNPRHHNPYKIT